MCIRDSFGLPGIVYWFVIIAIITHIALAYTRWGGHIYAVGGNEEAARLAGIKSSNVLASAYVVAAVVGGMAGVMLTARLGTASPVALPGAEPVSYTHLDVYKRQWSA